VTQGDGWASLSLVTKSSSGYRGLFQPRGDWQKVAYVDHVKYMVRDPTWIKRGNHVAY
jgi:hypothetical protein